MTETEMLRGLADVLRKEASRREDLKRYKAANVLVAAAGLGMLNAKLGGSRG